MCHLLVWVCSLLSVGWRHWKPFSSTQCHGAKTFMLFPLCLCVSPLRGKKRRKERNWEKEEPKRWRSGGWPSRPRPTKVKLLWLRSRKGNRERRFRQERVCRGVLFFTDSNFHRLVTWIYLTKTHLSYVLFVRNKTCGSRWSCRSATAWNDWKMAGATKENVTGCGKLV